MFYRLVVCLFLQVKKRVVQVISAMAHHGYLELEGGDMLVRFIIQHCALSDTYHVSSSFKLSVFTLDTHAVLSLYIDTDFRVIQAVNIILWIPSSMTANFSEIIKAIYTNI